MEMLLRWPWGALLGPQHLKESWPGIWFLSNEREEEVVKEKSKWSWRLPMLVTLTETRRISMLLLAYFRVSI